MGNILPLRIGFKRFEPTAHIPSKWTEGSVGWDLYACHDAILMSGVVLIDTGIGIELPEGYEAQVRPRSSFNIKGILTQFGTIDSDYRGRIRVALYMLSGHAPYLIRTGDRIAQLVVAPAPKIEFYEVADLGATVRGTGSFGSSGV